MARPSFSLAEYQQLARDKNLELIGAVPVNIKTKITWRCKHCGTMHLKSYHYLKYRKFGCFCQNGMSLEMSAYEELAKKFNLTPLFDKPPRNIFVKVPWAKEGDVMQTFLASYHQLGYDRVNPLKLSEYLENQRKSA